MVTVMSDMLARKRERERVHIADIEYVVRWYDRLRRIRGSRSQLVVACMADVVQSYISRVESGSTNGIGAEALRRILRTYEELEAC